MLIGVCGYAQTGKDETVKILSSFGFERRAFADKVREAVYTLNPQVLTAPITSEFLATDDDRSVRVQHLVDFYGWDHCKNEFPEIRVLLQRMGTEVGRQIFGDSFWIDQVLDYIDPLTENIAVSDVRFPNEADAVKAKGGKIIRIHRPGVKPSNGHASDTSVDLIEPDFVVMNDGTLVDLAEKVTGILKGIQDSE